MGEAVMKILIVGLLDKQASLVRSRYGRRLDITFASKSTKSGNGAFLSQVDNVDEVLLLQKFCSHEISKKIPSHKRKIVTGMKTLFEFLDHYDVINHMKEEELKPKPMPPWSAPAPVDDRVFMDAFDLNTARMMQPGDKIYFRKPEGSKLQSWKNTFHNKVHYYRKNYTLEFSVSFDYPTLSAAIACVEMPRPTESPWAGVDMTPPSPEPEGVLAAPMVLPPTEPPVTFGPVTVSVPLELTSTALNKLRTDPRSRDPDVGCMDEKIGWLVRAWPVILNREEEGCGTTEGQRKI
jgi:hypothetical protein